MSSKGQPKRRSGNFRYLNCTSTINDHQSLFINRFLQAIADLTIDDRGLLRFAVMLLARCTNTNRVNCEARETHLLAEP
jgi:hypothetical protein